MLAFVLFLCSKSRDSLSEQKKPLPAQRERQIKTHIMCRENDSERITLAAIAQELGYNEHYICRRFKAETGENLIDYIRRQKIRIAEILLEDPALSVAEISDRLGFSSPSYFGAVFKKQTGVGPTEYRQTLLHTQGESRFQSFVIEDDNH